MTGGHKNTSSRLRHKVTLQQEVQISDGSGGYAKNWENFADLWAEIMPVRGNEKLFAGKLQSWLTHKIVLRYRTGVSAGQRIMFDNRAFNIRYVNNVQENRDLLELLVEEGAGT